MSVRRIEKFHGAVLAKIVRATSGCLRIKFVESKDACSYEIDSSCGLYIKYSTKRLRPWQFSFSSRNQDEILSLREKFGEVFVALVCNTDGIVFLRYNELKEVLDEEHAEVEWVRVSRKPRGMYEIRGSDGKMKCRIGESSSLNFLLEYCNLKLSSSELVTKDQEL